MNKLRKWTTPALAGFFLLSACTGILMFFHAASPLARLAHEWLSWALVLGVALHLAVNLKALRHALRPAAAKVAVAALAIATVGAAVAPDARGSNQVDPGSLRMASAAVLDAPLDRVAALAGDTPDALRSKLEAGGLRVPGGTPTLREIANASGGRTRAVLEVALR